MQRVYLDEDVSVLLASLLGARGFDALTAQRAKMLGKTDEEHFNFAKSSQRILITHNRTDFERIYASSIQNSVEHFGILCLSRKRDVYGQARQVVQFLSKHQELDNQFWYL